MATVIAYHQVNCLLHVLPSHKNAVPLNLKQKCALSQSVIVVVAISTKVDRTVLVLNMVYVDIYVCYIYAVGVLP